MISNQHLVKYRCPVCTDIIQIPCGDDDPVCAGWSSEYTSTTHAVTKMKRVGKRR